MSKTVTAAEQRPESIGEVIRTIIYALLIALAVRTVAFEPFNIPSGSMTPTLLTGDYVFVSKFS
jgi:signal peptidase I